MSKELKVGAKAPTFKLVSDEGETVSLKDFSGQPLVLYFYPKDDTPGCTQEACDFRDYSGTFKKLKATIVGISKDSVEKHQKFKAKHELPFTLLSDAEGRACEAYGVWKEKSLYGRKFMGIERTTFLIDAAGKIAKIYPKVKVKGHIEEIVADLKELE